MRSFRPVVHGKRPGRFHTLKPARVEFAIGRLDARLPRDVLLSLVDPKSTYKPSYRPGYEDTLKKP